MRAARIRRFAWLGGLAIIAPSDCEWGLMKRILVCCIAILSLAACERIDPDSPLGKRKAIFQEMLDVKEDLGGMLRGRLEFRAEAFASGAQRLDALAHQPWQYYPEAKEAQSKARDDVWARQAQFEALARELEAATAALAEKARTDALDPSAVAAPFQAVEDTCERCHKAFRAY